MEMTIAKGLGRLKTIKSQLDKIVENIDKYAAWNNRKKHMLGDNKGTIEQTHNQAQEQINAWYQSFNDLLNEFLRIKRAVDKTNMETKITIVDTEMTIYEALCYRREIAEIKKNLVRAYGNAVSKAQVDVDRYNAQFANQAEEIRKINLADINYFIDKKKVDELDQYLTQFVTDIDGELNAVNATTTLKD